MLVMIIKYKVMVNIYPEDNITVDYTGVLYDTFEEVQKNINELYQIESNLVL